MPPAFSSTALFAQAVDPYSFRFSPPGAIYSPYGWGPDFNIGMPMNYTHHLDYVPDAYAVVQQRQRRTPIPGARRIGPMYDTLPIGTDARRARRRGLFGVGSYEGVYDGGVDTSDYQQLAGSGDGLGLGAILAVL
jgi:hypothetical protein